MRLLTKVAVFMLVAGALKRVQTELEKEVRRAEREAEG